MGATRAKSAARSAEAELRYQLVAHATNDAIWDWDLGNDQVAWNDAVYIRFGYPPSAVGTDAFWWMAQIHPDDRERVERGIQAVIAEGGQAWEDEYRWRRHDGTYAYVTDRGYVARDEDGRALRMIGAMTDTSARHEAEAALRRSEAQFRAMFERATDLIGVINPDGSPRYYSPSHLRVLGYTAEQMLERSMVESVHPDDFATLMAHFAELDTRGETPIEYRFKHADGGWRVVESQIKDLRDDPMIAGLIVTTRDITDRKRAEAELQRAKDSAEAASRVKSEFLANMSHEIRTPLNGIIGMAHLLDETALDAEQREYLDLMRSSADWLLELVNDVLDFSRIEAGKLVLEQRAFGLRETVGETIRVLAVRAADKGLQLSAQIAADVPTLLIGDPNRLRQILVNLVTNAIKFTEQGAVSVAVARAPGGIDPLVELHVTVADTGIGIPPDKQAAIFEAFEQADGSTTRRYGGSGLGLAIAQRLVGMMDGRIWLDSAPGCGSTFHFTIRCAVARARHAESGARGASELPATRSPQTPSRIPALRRLRILLAEDNLVNQRLAVRLLEKAGHTPIVVEDGGAAVSALEREHFDLVLMDVQMPRMGGLEATAAIRVAEATRGGHVPIVAMTAHAMAGDAERCLAAGMDDYVAKPIRPDRLYAAIERALGAARPASTDSALASIL